MGVLTNPKWERFAQELAKGKSASDAYVLAGYTYHQSNAARLSRKEQVLSRVVEILERLATKTEMTLERVTEMLLEDRHDARHAGQYAAAKSAVDSIAKLHGLLTDKHEIKGDIQITKVERVIVYPKD